MQYMLLQNIIPFDSFRRLHLLQASLNYMFRPFPEVFWYAGIISSEHTAATNVPIYVSTMTCNIHLYSNLHMSNYISHYSGPSLKAHSLEMTPL